MKNISTILLFVLTVLTAQSQVISDGLVGYWPLDGNANDLSANSFHGTLNGAAPDTGINGIANTCYDFRTGTIMLKNHTILLDTNVTVSVWVKPDTLATPGYPTSMLSLGLDTNNWYDDSNWSLYTWDGFTPVCTLHVATSPAKSISYSSSNKLVDNSWNHLIFERQGESTQIFLNNEIIATTKEWGSGKLGESLTYKSGVIGKGFVGLIDEMMMFDRVLTPAEKTILFSQQTGGTISVARKSSANLTISYSNHKREVIVTANQSFEIQVYTTQGVIVTEGNNSSLLLTTVPPGLYIVKATDGTSVVSKKVMIQ